MPIDYTHQHVSTSIMQVDSPHVPIDPTGGGGVTVTDGDVSVTATTIQSAFSVTNNGGGEAGVNGTIVAPAGAEGTGDLLFEIQGETGRTILSVDPYGYVNIKGAVVDPTNGGAGVAIYNTVPSIVHSLVGDDGNGHATLGFFGTSPVQQPAAPTTLEEVIAALQALGLVAS